VTVATVSSPHDAASAPALRTRWVVLGLVLVAAAALAGLTIGPVSLPVNRVVLELIDHIPFVHVHSGLSPREAAIVWDLRLPRVVMGLLVGAMLAVAGGSYQGAFRNPLADPYLLGVAAGAGLGATLVIVAGGYQSSSSIVAPLPLAAFGGALMAVALTYLLGASGGRGRSVTSLVLAGVAVASFLTAVQTWVQQRKSDTIREVYTWILGRLTTANWHDVGIVLPYIVVTSAVLIGARRALDVLSVGDEEATSLGLNVGRVRLIVVIAASLGTAAAVAVSGLIAFVGIIVPHTVRLLGGRSYRSILPLSLLFGAAFLTLTDLLARVVISPSELPIGVVTAFFGAPFFLIVLRTTKTAM
jgi:iron complex transport system permease protein